MMLLAPTETAHLLQNFSLPEVSTITFTQQTKIANRFSCHLLSLPNVNKLNLIIQD